MQLSIGLIHVENVLSFDDADVLRNGIVAETYKAQDGVYAGISNFPIWKRMSSAHHKSGERTEMSRQVNMQ